MTRKLWILVAVAVVALAFSAPAKADPITVGFTCITNNLGSGPPTCSNVAAQLSITIASAGTAGSGNALVSFTFNNAGPLASSITDIYFDDGTLLGIASITDSGAGVSFSQGCSPGSLPGAGNTWTTSFCADSDSPTQPKGVNPNEWVTITFELLSGKSFNDVVSALNLGSATGGLVIGIHVQGLANDQSESMINTPPTVIPEPGTLALFGTGLIGLAGVIRRRMSK